MVLHMSKNLFTRYGLLLIVAVLFIVFSLSNSAFPTAQNISAFLVGRVAVGFFAIAALVPLVAGEFDISLGYMLGFCTMLGAKVGSMGAPAWLTLLAAVLSGIFMGCMNGLLTVACRIPSTISTLGSGMVMYGLALGTSNSKSINGVIDSGAKAFSRLKIFGLNISIWLLILVGVILFYVLENTPFGRQIYAVGYSERVTRLAGARTKMLRFLSFVIAGLIIGVSAMIMLGQSGNAYPDTGPDFLMPGLATVFLSITYHTVGRYNVPGTLVALLLLGVVFNGIGLMGAPFWVEDVVNGVILLLVVLTKSSDARKAQTE